jgi:uncharacterized protein (DUF2141 family)
MSYGPRLLIGAALAASLVAGCGRSSLIGGGVVDCPPGAFCLPGPSDLAGTNPDGIVDGGGDFGIPDGGFPDGGFPDGGFRGDMSGRDMSGNPDGGLACGTGIPCTDPRCAGKPICITPGQEVCNNGIDDNDNGLIDCADPECFGSPFCQHLDGGVPRNDMGQIVCTNPDGSVNCNLPGCNQLPQCLAMSCTADVDFGTLLAHGSDVTKTMDTRTATRSFKTCAFPGGTGLVGKFVLGETADVRLDFTQATGGAHAITLNRAGFEQLCDQNELFCVQAGDAPTATHTFAALPAGTYYVIVQSYPGTQSSTTVELSTGKSNKPVEICDNGIDDDGNGLIDCADFACVNAPNCVAAECKPDLNLGALVVGAAPVVADFNTSSMGSNRFHPTCAGTSDANDYVVEFTLAETAGVLVNWTQAQGANHVISIFHMPPPGQACDASQVSCFYPGGDSGGEVAFSPKPPGTYVFIFKGINPASEGAMHIEVSAFINRGVEICNNGIDDDGNGLIDCADPACFGVDGCKPSICLPDVNLGDISWGTQVSATVDVTTGNDYYTATCAKGSGKNRVIRVNLTQPMGLGYECTETGSQVLQLTQLLHPLDACDKNPVNCADPTLLPFGCDFIMPNLQPGEYDILVEGFQAGDEGTVNLTLFGVQENVIEICNNGVDDDNNGLVDCADPACFTSPYCTGQACMPVKDLGILPLDGTTKTSVTVQTSGAASTEGNVACVVAAGGGDQDVDFQMPSKGNLTVAWAQQGDAVFALYPNSSPLGACDSGAAAGCVTTAGTATGSTTFSALPAGKYHLIVKADKPGDEGGAVLQLSGTPTP